LIGQRKFLNSLSQNQLRKILVFFQMKMRVGHRLLKSREERKLSQIQMAELLGVSQSVYSRMERNEGVANLEQIVNFSKILDVPVQEFLPDTISMQNHNEKGQVGMLIGNFYQYGNKEEVQETIIKEKDQQIELQTQETKFLKEKIKFLENEIENLKKINALLEQK